MSGLPPLAGNPLLAQQQQIVAAAAAAAAAARGVAVGGAAAGGDTGGRRSSQAGAKKRKPVEKVGEEKPLALIPESPVFNALMLQERELDLLIKRRRLEIQAAATPLDCALHKRLRVYVHATHAHQPAAGDAQGRRSSQHQQQDGGAQEPPQWTLWIWGRVIDPEPPGAPAAATSADAAAAGAAGAAARASAGGGTSGGGAAAPAAARRSSVDGSAGGAAVPPPPAAAAAATAGEGAAAAVAAASGGGDQDAAAAAQAASLPPAWSLPPFPSAATMQQHVGHRHPLTSFFDRIAIQLDPEQYPGAEGHLVWDRAQHRGPHKDRVEVKRVGSHPLQATITFTQHFVPPAYQLDTRLAEVLGMTFGQQQAVLTRLYSYIMSGSRQQQQQEGAAGDPTQLVLDDKLEAIMGTQQLAAAALPQALGKLLQPLQPVVVTHTIDPRAPSPGAITCVDFDVLLPTKPLDKVLPTLEPLWDDKQFEAQDAKQRQVLTRLFEARRRRAMLLGFSDDPLAFLDHIISSYAREFHTTRAGGTELERRSEAFRERWVDEAAARHLGRKNKQDALFPALNAP